MVAGGALVALAATLGWVIAGQLLAGAGGALILSNSLAILGATFTDPHRRTEVITAWSAASGIGLAAGPLIAGTLLQHFPWHSVFLSRRSRSVWSRCWSPRGRVTESRPSPRAASTSPACCSAR